MIYNTRLLVHTERKSINVTISSVFLLSPRIHPFLSTTSRYYRIEDAPVASAHNRIDLHSAPRTTSLNIFPVGGIAESIMPIGICNLPRLLADSSVAEIVLKENQVPGDFHITSTMATSEFRGVMHLDRPWSPVGEGSMDLFPRAAIHVPYPEYRRILFRCPPSTLYQRPHSAECILECVPAS